MKIAFFGSSLVSAYWNGACTYYRGIVRALDARGHRVAFYEPDAFDRQAHRDIDDPEWAEVVVYEPSDERAVRGLVAGAADADVVVKASGVGVFDAVLEEAVAGLEGPEARVFWDVDAPATLAAIKAGAEDELRSLIGRFDLVLTYGGGQPVIDRYAAFGARACVPVYNALDPTTHHPAPPRPDLACDLAFLGNRLPDREARVEQFFLEPAARLPERRFLIGGNGWDTKPMPSNVRDIGHVYTREHNAFNTSPLAVLNIARDSMATTGFSPATRVFEAAGASACLITDAWVGLELFLKENEEVLVARDGADVAQHVQSLTPARAEAIGERARVRILGEHTYARRGAEVDRILREERAARPHRSVA
jgi:spore maturation protein CgeB